jgi:2'-5' RNA ligase
MRGLISLLDPVHYRKVEALWEELEEHCCLSGVKITPLPHFSWQIATGYPEPETERIVTAIAGQSQPFKVHTGGLGIFSGPSPVVFLALVKSPQLEELHTKLWQQCSGSAQRLSPFYSPHRWMPHITLIFEETDMQSAKCGLELLAFRQFDWEIEINNISFASQMGDRPGTLDYRHDFPSV